MDDAPFTLWSHTVTARQPALILPDGCQDVLILRAPGRPAQVMLTPLDGRPRQTTLAAGTCITGWRLRPGTCPPASALAALTRDPGQAAQILPAALSPDPALPQLIAAIARADQPLTTQARLVGLSLRSLQRQFAALGLPPPGWWRGLGRARRAAAALATPLPLALIAADCGFADQAHMTRAMTRWFGQSPAALRADPQRRWLLDQPGLGNWTGEQISTR
ncbi:helix-turn-helix domain-containing protein [Paracoccus jiaweipingae]|uniref:helix-turn-helix domain-containing protein n=1 Tax=unclassified Paracoccus (in: a-proteobacteria) TaxID=2688777 RepID=UPI0037BCEA89